MSHYGGWVREEAGDGKVSRALVAAGLSGLALMVLAMMAAAGGAHGNSAAKPSAALQMRAAQQLRMSMLEQTEVARGEKWRVLLRPAARRVRRVLLRPAARRVRRVLVLCLRRAENARGGGVCRRRKRRRASSWIRARTTFLLPTTPCLPRRRARRWCTRPRRRRSCT